LSKYSKFLETSDNQFGFKKYSSCSNAIYSVRQAVNKFTNTGSTVNLCALDLSKAFDKLNHFGLFIELMKRAVPKVFLEVLEDWFHKHLTCVRFGSATSLFVSLECGVRQGGVLSPHLFAIYIDVIVGEIARSKFSCTYRFTCISVFMYADDLILLSPSVSSLQEIINIVEEQLLLLEMSVNVSKSACLRFGPRHKVLCADMKTSDGHTIQWVTKCLYLGKLLLSSNVFKCDFENEKKSLFKSFNAIFGKIGRFASTEVVIHLLKTKCLPTLLYALNACPINLTEYKSFDFALFRILAKVFSTFSKDLIDECRAGFDLPLLKETIRASKLKFLNRYMASNNELCSVFADKAKLEIDAI
jgi:hypothetical protein